MSNKTIVITGMRSYVGTRLAQWLDAFGDTYTCKFLDVRDNAWQGHSFAKVDAVVHTAGIVHQPSCTDWQRYKSANIDLTEALAARAKSEGVPHFVFISSMAVYGQGKSLEPTFITEGTSPAPRSLYGKSKYEAEEKLRGLADGSFAVSIVRPSNIYGPACRGNYIPRFVNAAKKLPVVPDCFRDAKQSMLYIDNLSELLRLIIDTAAPGLFLPQDERPLSSVDLICAMRNAMGKKTHGSKALGRLVSCCRASAIVQKAYGGVAYQVAQEPFAGEYRVVSIEDAMRATVAAYA